MKECFVGVERGKVRLLHQQNELNETLSRELELTLAVGDVIASKPRSTPTAVIKLVKLLEVIFSLLIYANKINDAYSDE